MTGEPIRLIADDGRIRPRSWLDSQPWKFLFSTTGPWWTRTRVWLIVAIVTGILLGGVHRSSQTTVVVMPADGSLAPQWPRSQGERVRIALIESQTASRFGTSRSWEVQAVLAAGGRPLSDAEVADALAAYLQGDPVRLKECADFLQAIRGGRRSLRQVDLMFIVASGVRNVLGPAVLILGFVGLVRTVRRFGQRPLPPDLPKRECAACGYPLVGLPSRVCPECGHESLPAPEEIDAAAAEPPPSSPRT